jgi:hypothetical protein
MLRMEQDETGLGTRGKSASRCGPVTPVFMIVASGSIGAPLTQSPHDNYESQAVGFACQSGP